MDKITYLAELAEGLARWVPERERQDILRYYAEYFEEAGPGREAEVVAELGDPWALSCRLAVEGGYVTREKAASWRPGKRWPKVLIGAAAGLTVFALVYGIGLLAFNVVRNVSGPAGNASVSVAIDPSGRFGPIEQAADGTVTVVDWGIVEESALIDGESVASFSSIEVDVSIGNIEVVAGGGYTLSVRRSEVLLGYEPVLEIRDGVLRLRDGDLPRQVRVDSWDDLKNWFGTDQLLLEVIITVPEEAVLDKISVKSGLGNVLLYGVCAETVTAETGLGNVECYEARNVRKLELNTGLGDVGLLLEEVHSGLDIELDNGKGNVEVSLACSESDCQYDLESGLGTVTVNGGRMGSEAVHKGSLPYKLSAESGMGDINVYFFG